MTTTPAIGNTGNAAKTKPHLHFGSTRQVTVPWTRCGSWDEAGILLAFPWTVALSQRGHSGYSLRGGTWRLRH